MATSAHDKSISLSERLEVFGQRRFLTSRDVFQGYIDLVVEFLDCEIGYLHGFKPDCDEIQLNVWSTSVYGKCAAVNDSHYPVRDAGIWADAIRLNKTVTHNKYPAGTSLNGMPDGHFKVSNHMSTPIYAKGEIVAVIGVGNKISDFTEDDMINIERLMKLGWPLVLDRINEHGVRARSQGITYNHRNPQDVLIAMVKTVSKALELRDEYTSHHQSNVATLAESIAFKLGLPKEQRFGIHLGSLVHDIGKIAIPSQILAKPGKLNKAEVALVQMHPALGAQIFDDVDLPWPIVDIIAQHHERMDGSGYPDGLVGKSICTEAGIVAVADTFDAMASPRPYRRAPGKDAAIDVLKQGQGSKFDSNAVDAFLMIINEDPALTSTAFLGSAL